MATVADISKTVLKSHEVILDFWVRYYSTPAQKKWMVKKYPDAVKLIAKVINETSDLSMIVYKNLRDPKIAAAFESKVDRKKLEQFGIRPQDKGRFISMAIIKESNARLTYMLNHGNLNGYNQQAVLDTLYGKTLTDEEAGFGFVITTTIFLVGLAIVVGAMAGLAAFLGMISIQEETKRQIAEANLEALNGTIKNVEAIIAQQPQVVKDIMDRIASGQISEDAGMDALEKYMENTDAAMMSAAALQNKLAENMRYTPTSFFGSLIGEGMVTKVLIGAGIVGGVVLFLKWRKSK